MAPPPEQRKKRKKKGRPSLIELQKRSIRLEKQMLQESNAGKEGGEDDDMDEGGRKEKKLKFVLRLPGGDDGGDAVKQRRLDGAPDRDKLWIATSGGGSQGPGTSDSGPMATPLPDKKLLVFILDRLQKKDTYGVFAEPVDPEELPDYHDIIKHPMDFATIRKKVDKGAYANLEQFEDDVFLISSNAMCYNAPETIYYRQARAIQELAKKDFEDLRRESSSSDGENPRRGRPAVSSTNQKVGRPVVDRVSTDFSSGSTLANAVSNGRLSYAGLDLQRRGIDKPSTVTASRGPHGIKSVEINRAEEHKSFKIEDYSGGKGFAAKNTKKLIIIDETRRNTHTHPISSRIHEPPVLSTFDGLRKLLLPVGLQMQHSYPRSLARFAAKLGPVGWGIAAKRIERSLPPGTKFGPGWVGESEAPQTSQAPEVRSPLAQTSSAELHSSVSSTGDQPHKSVKMEACDANLPLSEAQSHVASNKTSENPEVVPPGCCEKDSMPGAAQDAVKHEVVTKSPKQHSGYPLMQQPINGFIPAAVGHNAAFQTGKIPSTNSHGEAYHAADNRHFTPDVRQDHGVQQDSPANTAAPPIPPDLNVGFQSPGKSAAKHSDLLLQL